MSHPSADKPKRTTKQGDSFNVLIPLIFLAVLSMFFAQGNILIVFIAFALIPIYIVFSIIGTWLGMLNRIEKLEADNAVLNKKINYLVRKIKESEKVL